MLSLYCLAVLIHLAGTAMNRNRKLLTLSVASTPKKLTMTNVGYAGTLAKADTEQAAAIEEKLKDFNTNVNGVEVIGIGEPNAPAGAKRYSGYDE